MAGHVVKVSVTANTKKFSTAFRNLKNETGLTSLQATAATAVSTMAKVAAAASVAMGAASAKAVSMAANLEQSTGAIEAVFKKSAEQMKRYAATAATSVGLARNEYQELATVLGSQLKNGGTSMDELAGKTNDLIKTAADLSAMFGGTTADAVAALSSALKGERNPIERYGVSLKQATIDAKAAAMGFEKVGGALSNEANQAATLALIMEQTADAHGAFARENDTLAHQIQVIKAKLSDAATAFGTLLLPAVTKVAQYLNDNLTPAIDKIQDFLQSRLIPAVKDFAARMAAALTPVIDQAAAVLTNTLIPAAAALHSWLSDKLPPAIAAVAEFVKQWGAPLAAGAAAAFAVVKAFQAWAKIKAIIEAAKIAMAAFNVVMAANPIGLVVAAVGLLVAGIVALWQNSETFRTVVTGAWKALQDAAAPVIEWATTTLVPTLMDVWESLKAATAEFLSYLPGLWNEYGQPLIDAIATLASGIVDNWNGIWEGSKTYLSGVWQTISAIISTALGIIGGIVKVFTGALSGDWSRVWEGIKSITTALTQGIYNIISSWFTALSGLVRAGWNVISGIVNGAGQAIVNAVSGAWQRAKDAAANGVSNVVTLVKSLPSRALEALGNLGSTLYNAGANLIRGFIDGIRSMISSVKATLSDLTNMLPDWKGPASLDRVLLARNGQLIIGGLIAGMQSKYPDVQASLAGLTNLIGSTDFTPGHGFPTSTARHSGHTINVYTLTPTLETGRAIAQALANYERMNGAGR